MSQQGFNQIADQLQSTNDFVIAKQAAAQQWRQSHGQTLDGFDTFWNSNTTPGVFLLNRLQANPTVAQQLFSNLQSTPDGVAAMKQLRSRYTWALQNHVFDPVTALSAGSAGTQQ